MSEILYRLVDGERVPIDDAEAEAIRTEWAAAPRPTARMIPVALVRERLEAAGRYDALVQRLTPAQVLKLATLREGVDPADPQVRGLLAAIGADPAAILAPP